MTADLPIADLATPGTATTVRARDLVKSFGETPALRGASLTVRPGRDRRGHGAERIGQIHADLVITPRAQGVGLLEFHQLDTAREAGRAAAREALERASGGLNAARTC